MYSSDGFDQEVTLEEGLGGGGGFALPVVEEDFGPRDVGNALGFLEEAIREKAEMVWRT